MQYERVHVEWLPLHADHAQRPIWVCSDGSIFLEVFYPYSKKVEEFLTLIADPVSRPGGAMNEYKLSLSSLYSGISMGLEPRDILEVMRSMCKHEIPEDAYNIIINRGSKMGRVRLHLRNQQYYLVSNECHSDLLDEIIQHPDLRGKYLLHNKFTSSASSRLFLDHLRSNLNNIASEESKIEVMVRADQVDLLRNVSHKLDLPVLEEYHLTPSQTIWNMKPTTVVRPYQIKAISQMFSGGTGRSGIIVLPCGSGKTLVGITAMTIVSDITIILTSTSLAVEQWKREIMRFTSVNENEIFLLAGPKKEPLPARKHGIILISTFTMFGVRDCKRGEASETIIRQARNLEWGLLILDEVQLMPAKSFRSVSSIAKSHLKLGLTATLVREDELIADLNWLVGPKLYEANWEELQNCGFVARCQCVEVWCTLSAEFYREYIRCILSEGPGSCKSGDIAACNPHKLMACEFLIQLHEERGDKIIVFSDNVYILHLLSDKMNKDCISGKVSFQERCEILHRFSSGTGSGTLMLSRVGDNAIDIPCANVVIQLTSHYGSRRQEAQRLGRILRPKPGSTGQECNAFFYTLISRDTREIEYAEKRQRFLIDQGYSYKIVPDIEERMKTKGIALQCADKGTQHTILSHIMTDYFKVKKKDNAKRDANRKNSSSPSKKNPNGTSTQNRTGPPRQRRPHICTMQSYQSQMDSMKRQQARNEANNEKKPRFN